MGVVGVRRICSDHVPGFGGRRGSRFWQRPDSSQVAPHVGTPGSAFPCHPPSAGKLRIGASGCLVDAAIEAAVSFRAVAAPHRLEDTRRGAALPAAVILAGAIGVSTMTLSVSGAGRTCTLPGVLRIAAGTVT